MNLLTHSFSYHLATEARQRIVIVVFVTVCDTVRLCQTYFVCVWQLSNNDVAEVQDAQKHAVKTSRIGNRMLTIHNY